jgi:hypothetical protein
MNCKISHGLGLLALAFFSCSLAAQEAPPATTDDAQTYLEVLRSRFNANKVATINEVLKLTPKEEEKFWPIYRAYEQELAGVGDQKLELIREFFKYYNTGSLTDERAQALSEKWLKNLQQRTDLWKKYHKKISKAVSPTRGAQFLQVENQMALFVDICIASEMPVVGRGGKAMSSGR